jgi:hypothetical protein
MAPLLTDGQEIRFNVDRRRHTLLVRDLHPRTASDHVTSSAGFTRRDQGVMSTYSGAGIASSAFYTGQPTITGQPAGSSVYLQASAGKSVVLVQFED